MHDRTESEKRRRACKNGEAKGSAPGTTKLSGEEVDDQTQQQCQQQHRQARPLQYGRGTVPPFEEPFAEDPLAQVCREKFVAKGPRDVLVVRANAANHQRNRSQHFRKRRVLGIQAQVQSLQVTDASADMGDFVHSNGFSQRGSAPEQRHQCQQQHSEDGAKNAARLGIGLHFSSSTWIELSTTDLRFYVQYARTTLIIALGFYPQHQMRFGKGSLISSFVC